MRLVKLKAALCNKCNRLYSCKHYAISKTESRSM